MPPLHTEDRLERFAEAERWPTRELVEAMLERQLHALVAVREALPALARAAEAVAERLAAGSGRLVYCGAGTSGRLAVQDGVELVPTFCWPRERLAFVLAGGEAALLRPIEGAEDDVEAARSRIVALGIGPEDVHIAVAASGTTPFVRAAQAEARARGALTVALANNPGAPLLAEADHPLLLATGPEVLAGSTRMVAGTAQKIALNLLSTAVMYRLGRVYRGRMVALVPGNAKLRARAIRILCELTAASEAEAQRALEAAAGDVRLAVLLLDGLSPEEARRRLDAAGGDLSRARQR
jgi:N-acetylmuramic acid 6-phosphate etherase